MTSPPPLRALTWDEVDTRRLATNHLTVPADPSDLAGVVSRACGIQAQVLSAAELALSARIPALRTADVRAAPVGAPDAGQDLRPPGHHPPAGGG